MDLSVSPRKAVELPQQRRRESLENLPPDPSENHKCHPAGGSLRSWVRGAELASDGWLSLLGVVGECQAGL